MADSKVDTVEAKTLKVGDFIFFPNSRHAQRVEQIVESGGDVSLVADDATWQVGTEAPIRKVAS